MKVLKKQGLTLLLIAALVVTLTLGIVFMLPARTASAEEVNYGEPVSVSDEQALKAAVENAGTEPTLIRLDESFTLTDSIVIGMSQNIKLDLNGHNLDRTVERSSQSLFTNYGKLSVVDSSDYKGLLSTGSADGQHFGPVIYNAGDLTVDANMTSPSTNGMQLLVNNVLHTTDISAKEDLVPVHMTINGGTFTGWRQLFDIYAADVTITGGTFVATDANSALFAMDSLALTEHEEWVAEYRSVEINISGGDFRKLGSTSSAKLLYTFNYADGTGYADKIPGEEYTVLISGGLWGKDYSAYTDVDHTMMEERVTEQEGTVLVESYYVVTEVDKASAVATLEQNGKIVAYYPTFDSAWSSAMLQTTDRTIKLQKDTTSSMMLSVSGRDVDTVLDLNGHSLMISPPISSRHYHFFNSSSNSSKYFGKIIVRDSTDSGNSELILNYLQGATEGGIHLGGGYQFILESGTIRTTGVTPSTSSKQNIALFQFSTVSSKQREEAIVIKGGNVVSDLGTDGVYFGAWAYHKGTSDQNWSFSLDKDKEDWKPDAGYETPDKYESLTFDIEEYLASHNTMKFSWDLTAFLPEGYNCVASGDSYIVTKLQEEDNYFANGQAYTKLADALAAAPNGDSTVTLLRNMTEESEVEIPAGITLDLNRYLHFTLAATSLTLNENTAVRNGTVDANVIVKGKTSFSKLTVKKDLTVENGGDLTITDGTYDGNITVNGGKLLLMGGKFADDGADDTKLKTYDQYIQPGFGATKVENGYRTVKGGLASLAALEWYNGAGTPNAAAIGYGIMAIAEVPTTYTINDTTEWLYFSSIVNSGTDNFAGDTVKLADDLKDGSLSFKNSIFIPAGTAEHGFAGTFDGNGKTISDVKAQEHYAGIIGVGDRTIKVTNLTVKDSTFVSGPGYLDDISTGWSWGAAGSIVGAGFIGQSSQLTINGNAIDTEYGYVFLGGVIGHTFGSVNLTDVTMTGSSVEQCWKSGGIVGYVESGLYLEDLNVSGLEFTGTSGGWCPSGVLAGDLNSSKAVVTNANIDCPDLRLNGSSSCGVAVTVEGPKTDIHVDSLGGAGKFTLKLESQKDEDDNVTSESKVQVNQFNENDKNRTEISRDGATVPPEENPDGDGFIMEGAPKKVELFHDKGEGEDAIGELVGSYDTLADALANAQDGDRLYLKSDLTETVTVGSDKNVTINLYNNTLTGTITVEGDGNLTLENGTVKGSVANSGTLTLATGENGLIIENSAAAVTGTEYVLADDDVCVRETLTGDVVTRLELATSHEFTKYTAAGGTITISCVHDNVVLGTVKVVAPVNATFGDEAIEATVEISEGLELGETPKITYKNAEGGVVAEITEAGTYTANITLGTATASVTFTVNQKELVISDIQGTVGYQGEGQPTLAVSSYVLKDLAGNVVEDHTGITVTVTLQKSNYGVGKQIALITAIDMTGNGNYTLATAGNEAFLELEVTERALTVRVNRDGSVSYEGFVNGEDESVLEGELHLERVDNGDGTSTVTPSGLTSANYVITFESGIVENEQSNNALWITLAVVGGVIAALGAVAVVYAVRRKKN